MVVGLPALRATDLGRPRRRVALTKSTGRELLRSCRDPKKVAQEQISFSNIRARNLCTRAQKSGVGPHKRDRPAKAEARRDD